MTEPFWELTTLSGLKIFVRTANANDDAILDELFHRVRKEDLRFRFLSAMKEVSSKRIHEMTHVDHRAVETYIAFSGDEKTGVATAVLASDQTGERGEVAISVRADDLGKGIGWELLSFVARQAKARGMKIIQSIESRANHDAIQLEREMGFDVKPFPGDATLVLVSKKLDG